MLILQFQEIRREMDHQKQQHDKGQSSKRKAVSELRAWIKTKQLQDMEEMLRLFEEGWLDG